MDADWLNIATHWIRAEAAAVSKSHTFPYLPRLVEAAALTLSDSKRLAVLLERRHGAVIHIDRDICDPDVFGELISHSGEAREMSAYTCTLFKEVIKSQVLYELWHFDTLTHTPTVRTPLISQMAQLLMALSIYRNGMTMFELNSIC